MNDQVVQILTASHPKPLNLSVLAVGKHEYGVPAVASQHFCLGWTGWSVGRSLSLCDGLGVCTISPFDANTLPSEEKKQLHLKDRQSIPCSKQKQKFFIQSKSNKFDLKHAPPFLF